MGRGTNEHHGYEDLANAIVIVAARDYRIAHRRYRNGNDYAFEKIKQIEKFFNSPWGDLLCHGKAKDILTRLQAEQGSNEVIKRMAKPKLNELKQKVEQAERQCSNCKYNKICSWEKREYYKITKKECMHYKERQK